MPETIRLPLELAPLPVGFQGTPQQWAEAVTERLRVLFPTGLWTFVIQDTEPPSNQGPWIKDQQLFLWNEDEKRYMPLDISNVWQVAISEKEPTDPGTSPIWIRYLGNLVTGVFVYLNGKWVPVFGNQGTTEDRPVNPPNFTRYFDTSIMVEIFYYQGLWKTVSGSPGDIKFVRFFTLAEALKYNPGWQEIGNYIGTARGRVFVPCHKDYGANPAADYPPLTGITSRIATEYFGEENIKLLTPQLPAHFHIAWIGAPVFTPNQGQSGGDGDNYKHQGGPGQPSDLLTQTTGSGEAHPNIQPTLALWCLCKG
jgi:hypothetical protein